MITKKRFLITTAILCGSGIILWRRMKRNTEKKLSLVDFKVAAMAIQCELPFKLELIQDEVNRYQISNKIKTSSIEGIELILTFKFSALKLSIEEICSDFNIKLNEFIEFFNVNSEKFFIANLDQGIEREFSVSFLWPKSFTLSVYIGILRIYLDILKNYIDSGDYIEYISQEYQLYSIISKKYSVGISELQGAHYKFSGKPEVKSLLKSIKDLQHKKNKKIYLIPIAIS